MWAQDPRCRKITLPVLQNLSRKYQKEEGPFTCGCTAEKWPGWLQTPGTQILTPVHFPEFLAGDYLRLTSVIILGQAILHVPSIQKRLMTDDKETAEEMGQR